MPDVDKRAPFELLAFTAAPVAGALVVIELEGRFAVAPAQNGRFSRRPMLVVEPVDDGPRLELAPVRAELHDAYWRGAYAIPAEGLADARFALGLRGTLLELPAPDALEDTDRLIALAREANTLRRALEAAEAEAATARTEADAIVDARRVAGEREAAVRDEADAARADAVAEAAAGHEQELAEASSRAAAAEACATDAEARARAAEKAVRDAEAGLEVLRAELAEERERSRTIVAEDPDATAIHLPTPRVGRPGPAVDAPTPASTHTTQPRGPGPWIAVAALVLFAFVLLGLLAGFLA
jgi:hypothetical protein